MEHLGLLQRILSIGKFWSISNAIHRALGNNITTPRKQSFHHIPLQGCCTSISHEKEMLQIIILNQKLLIYLQFLIQQMDQGHMTNIHNTINIEQENFSIFIPKYLHILLLKIVLKGDVSTSTKH